MYFSLIIWFEIEREEKKTHTHTMDLIKSFTMNTLLISTGMYMNECTQLPFVSPFMVNLLQVIIHYVTLCHFSMLNIISHLVYSARFIRGLKRENLTTLL